MEGMKGYGWSVIDLLTGVASSLLFKTEKAATQYKAAMNEHHPAGRYELIELFVKEE